MKNLDDTMFNVSRDDEVPEGIAVILNDDGKELYVGPINKAPPVPGCHMILNPLDYDVLHEIVMRKRGKYH